MRYAGWQAILAFTFNYPEPLLAYVDPFEFGS
jgi:hypothetical protein